MVEVVVFYRTLMRFAYEMGQAELSKNKERYEEAKKRHDEYVELCKLAKKMII